MSAAERLQIFQTSPDAVKKYVTFADRVRFYVGPLRWARHAETPQIYDGICEAWANGRDDDAMRLGQVILHKARPADAAIALHIGERAIEQRRYRQSIGFVQQAHAGKAFTAPEFYQELSYALLQDGRLQDACDILTDGK